MRRGEGEGVGEYLLIVGERFVEERRGKGTQLHGLRR